jgi:leucyl aminopeptidase (aminopeptidase T)
MDRKTVIENIFKKNFCVKPGETVLIYTDTISKDENITKKDRSRREKLIKIASDFMDIGKNFGNVKYIEYESLKEHGNEPPIEVWKSAFGKSFFEFIKENKLLVNITQKIISGGQKKLLSDFTLNHNGEYVNAVIALSNFSTSHTLFRDLITNYGGARFASMPLFEDSMFETALNIDTTELADFTLNVYKKLLDASKVNISAKNGTDITFYIRENGFMSDTGLLNSRGSFSNLPAGEVYTAPLENMTHGKFVMEYAPTSKLKKPLTLYIDKGKLSYIEGDDNFKRHLTEAIEKNNLVSNIAELGIGTNRAAKNFQNILEAEKIYGTIHMALGDNSSFGGIVRVNFHEDFILFNPEITVTTKDGNSFKLSH